MSPRLIGVFELHHAIGAFRYMGPSHNAGAGPGTHRFSGHGTGLYGLDGTENNGLLTAGAPHIERPYGISVPGGDIRRGKPLTSEDILSKDLSRAFRHGPLFRLSGMGIFKYYPERFFVTDQCIAP
jgi:hypothetical protein